MVLDCYEVAPAALLKLSVLCSIATQAGNQSLFAQQKPEELKRVKKVDDAPVRDRAANMSTLPPTQICTCTWRSMCAARAGSTWSGTH